MSTLEGTTGRRRLYLMRHGHVDYFAPGIERTGSVRDVVLTERGRTEAQAAAHAFAPVALDRALSSNLPRARETAEIVLGLQAQCPRLDVEPALAEIRGGRLLSVANRNELVATMEFHFARANEPGATMLENGEAFLAAQTRAVGVVRRILAEPGWRQALIVAHEGINRLVLSWASGAALAATAAFEQDTGCINVIDFDMVPTEDGAAGPEIARAIIKAVNLTPYNYLKHGMNMTSLEAIFTPEKAEG
jgi:broad specificity phosphatase PhoE